MRWPRPSSVAVAVALAVVCAFALNLPVSDLDGRVQRDVGDPMLNVWALSWESSALWGEPADLYDGNIFWPEATTIAYSESMLPLVPVFGALRVATGGALAANAVLVWLLVLGAVGGAYALARRFVRCRAAALLAGVSYGLGGYTVAHVAQVQLLSLGAFPLVFLLWFRALERRTWPSAVACGVAVAVLALSSLYYGVVLAPCLAVAALVQLARGRTWRDRATLGTVAVAAVVAVVLTAPGLVAYLRLDARQSLDRPIEPLLELELDDLLTPPPESSLYEGLARRGLRSPAVNEHALFPGFVALGLAVVGVGALVASRRRGGTDARRDAELDALGAAAVVAVVLALGGEYAGVPMPFRLLHDRVPGFGGIRATSRLVVPALVTLAVLGALGLDALVRRLPGRAAPAAALAAAAVTVAEVWAPVPWVRVDDRAAVYAAIDDRAPGAVVELPMGDPRLGPGHGAPTWALAEPTRMVRSLTDANPRVNGYSGHVPPGYLEVVDRLNAFPSRDSLRLLDDLDVRYVVLHLGPAADGEPQYDVAGARAVVDALPEGWGDGERIGRAVLLEVPG